MNVLVILDGSGSMGKDVGGQTQMEAAKKAIVHSLKIAEGGKCRTSSLRA